MLYEDRLQNIAFKSFITQFIMMMPFIIVNLVLVDNNQSICLSENIPGISFTLKGWLITDAVIRLGLLAVLLLMAVLSCCCTPCLKCWVIICVGFGCVFGLLFFAWLIVGAVMFWGTLNDLGTCDSQVSGYMWATLIINFVLIAVGCVQGKQSQDNL